MLAMVRAVKEYLAIQSTDTTSYSGGEANIE